MRRQTFNHRRGLPGACATAQHTTPPVSSTIAALASAAAANADAIAGRVAQIRSEIEAAAMLADTGRRRSRFARLYQGGDGR